MLELPTTTNKTTVTTPSSRRPDLNMPGTDSVTWGHCARTAQEKPWEQAAPGLQVVWSLRAAHKPAVAFPIYSFTLQVVEQPGPVHPTRVLSHCSCPTWLPHFYVLKRLQNRNEEGLTAEHGRLCGLQSPN